MPSQNPLTSCIFDLDGVIVDTAKYHFQAWRRLSNELGFDFDEHANEGLKGVGRMESLEIILDWGNIQLSQEEKQAWADRKNGWYQELIRQMNASEILPGAMEFLEEVKGLGKHIALGSSSKNARTILDYIGLGEYFDVVIDGNSITRTKPDPQVFLLCAEGLNQAPASCVVFEDAQSGVDAAIAGGFYAVGVGKPESLGHAYLVIPGFVGWDWNRIEKYLNNKGI
ncbi:MAG: beta-phosphoglucomutase [Saprospirales bacterium]|nr:beta-phosphoglucomutase [Saprospirales bacterium]